MRMPLTVALTLVGGVLFAGEVELARVDDVKPEQIVSRRFVVSVEQKVEVGGVKLRRNGPIELTSAWILDAASREPVWRLESARKYNHQKLTSHFKDSVHLRSGEYELYLSTFPSQPADTSFKNWLKRLFRMDRGYYEQALREVEIWIRGHGRNLGENTAETVRDHLGAGAIAALTCIGDEESVSAGFRLDHAVEVSVYAVGELARDSAYDSAWLVDASTRRRVWSLDYWNSDRAGGATKNRTTSTDLRLEPGTYNLVFATDDSHSCPHFNAAPPYDPFAWGVTIRQRDPASIGNVTTLDLEDVLDRNVVADLTRLENRQHRSLAFTLDRPMELMIHAVGEGEDGELSDYGWIVDGRSRETIWEMRYRDTEHAGGAEKNRSVQEVLAFAAGSYIVHFVSDGSHAYKHWNEAPPFEPERWGIIVVSLDPGFSPDHVAAYDPDDDPAILASIRHVRNRASESRRFTLNGDGEVLIYALGEGSRGDMYDYGWIENAADRSLVWQMEYWMTDDAGGAAKNRIYRGQQHLPAGTYVLHYHSDGSHAFQGWNASPPHDPESWGITVYRVDRRGHVEDPGRSR